ncbi:DUF2752 domain-containing protein [Mucilaginibacter ginsenosidivorans]|uniref:DUF2752 domain-containing protein n=1 Tax=Mucilaginibacter ginsenosidivorans TaxID=398053 RepID=UPI001E44B721|nr:DUF2752 domain-containing protein [Mucilaginibacter ginsenosidivorans]
MIKRLFSKYFELVFWIAAIAALAFADPAGPAHFSLCPFKALGFTWCPGCGLGHSIAWLFHGNITNSWHAHWLGIPALGIIFYRIYSLVRLRFFDQNALLIK